MNIQRATPVNEVLAKLLFLVLPTAAIGYFVVDGLLSYKGATYVSINNALFAAAFAVGMGAALLFYAFRFRFLLPFIGLLLLFYFASKGIDRLPGEFDGLNYKVKFLGTTTLFTIGWVFGWGFLRLRYFSIFSAAIMLAGAIPVIAKLNNQTEEGLAKAFVPVLIYAAYIIFAAEQIYNYKDKSKKFWWFLSYRVGGFAVVAALLIGLVWWFQRNAINDTIANFGSGGKAGEESLLQKDSNGNFNLKEYTRLQPRLARSNQLLFIAHIDNFFEGTDVPNPLYLTAFYYTKFDTATETFERDVTIPDNDLFEPDPGKVPLFSTKSDSSVIRNSGTEKLGKVVEVEIYNKQLSPETYLAPHTGFFVQPITVEKEFRDSFRSAYRAKSYVSSLNSAYFVYNAYKSKEIIEFQEARWKVLRQVANYEGVDPAFMKYYTYMPQGARWDRIGALSRSLSAAQKTPIDRILKLRSYFSDPDSLTGKQRFTYTDNPGVPGIPDASKLESFLFDTKRGYCAYYAGATLFMLRSLGIPSRIAVGFLTEERSSKNPGWYWYYANQAHAWVQVYFPGYGWLDFDTTVGDEGPHEAPATDGTPPLQPPRAWLAAEGVVQGVDTVKKMLQLRVKQFIFRDKEFRLTDSSDVVLDVHVAVIRRDSIEVPLKNVQKGDVGTAVSYADAFKNLELRNGEAALSLLKRFPDPEPIDEVYLRKRPGTKQKDTPPPAPKKDAPTDWKTVAINTGIVMASLILLFFLSPLLVWAYLRIRTGNATGESKAYWTYRSISFYLHQLGYRRGSLTPMQYAREVVDPTLGTEYARFMNSYLKLKYAKQPLTPAENSYVAPFLSAFLQTSRRRIPLYKRAFAFLNPFRMLGAFVKEERG